MKLYELDEIRFKNIFVDGTKIETNANRYLSLAWESIKTTDNGYQKKTKYYRTDSCAGCPYRDKCYKGKADFRKIHVSESFNEYRKNSV